MKLAIGTANFYCNYGTTKNYLKSKDAVEKVLLFLKRKKIFIIDTALNYDGNEKFFHNHDLKSFKIITKLKLSKKKNIVKYYLNTLNNNLKKNNLKNYESVLIHNTKSLKQFPKETIKLLKQIKKKKITKKIGFSIYESSELDLILTKIKPDIIQIPINIFNHNFANLDFINKLKKKNIEIHARSIFLQGILLNNKLPITLEKYQKNLDYWNNFNKRNFITELRSCIEYIKLFNIDYAVCGFNSPIQLKEIYNNFMKKPKKINFDPIKLRLPKKFYDPRYWN